MKKIFILALIGTFLIPSIIYAAEFKYGKESYFLNPSETISENLYAASNVVTLSGNVDGDAFLAGGQVLISGKIDKDIFAAGGTVNVGGEIKDDARVAGGTLIISAKIGGELMGAGGQVNIGNSALIENDVNVAGGSINFQGIAKKSVEVAGKQIYIDGQIDGDLVVHAQEVSFGPSAVVNGSFEYYAPSKAVIAQGAQIKGETKFHQVEMNWQKNQQRSTGIMAGLFTGWWLIKTLMILVAAFLFYYLWKPGTKDLIKQSMESFGTSFLRGFVFMFIIPIASIILFITVVGVIPAFVMLLSYGALMVLSCVLASLIVASFVAKNVLKRSELDLNWWVILIGVLVFQIVKLIPFVGWILNLVFYFVAFGTICWVVWEKVLSYKK